MITHCKGLYQVCRSKEICKLRHHEYSQLFAVAQLHSFASIGKYSQWEIYSIRKHIFMEIWQYSMVDACVLTRLYLVRWDLYDCGSTLTLQLVSIFLVLSPL